MFSVLPHSPHTMSLYIHMKMILPLNFSGWHCNSVINLWISSRMPSQCSESWEYFPLELHRLSINSIQIFEIAIFQIPFNFHLPGFDWFGHWYFPDRAPSRRRRSFGHSSSQKALSHSTVVDLHVGFSRSTVVRRLISVWSLINFSVTWSNCFTDIRSWFLVNRRFSKKSRPRWTAAWSLTFINLPQIALFWSRSFKSFVGLWP